MIYINHDKKAIFIHIPKTGGSYIGPTLVKYYGFTNYLPILNKRRPDHESYCQTELFTKVLTKIERYDTSFFNKKHGLLEYCKSSEYLNKMLNMDEHKWETYTKFCFIRNPYERALSGWNHLRQILPISKNFYDYINNPNIVNTISDIEYGHIFMSQKTQIQNMNGECGVNIIGRFEHLENDFRIILKHLGFKNIIHPNEKKNVSNKSGYKNIILEKIVIQKLNELFADDFEMFHYNKII